MKIYRDILVKIIETAIEEHSKREAERAKAREEVQK